MIAKVLVLALFSACQAASNEPWWIQMFFPGVSFTGKYHPSNYKVDKSPLFPDYVQNPNDVWSPAYWMPYKMAYAQYWIDKVNNESKVEEQYQPQEQAQAGQNLGYDQSNQHQGHNIVEEAQEVAEEVAVQAQNMNQVAQQIAEQAASEAQQQIQAVSESANAMKEEVEAQAEAVNTQAAQAMAQIDQAAEAQISEIAQQSGQIAGQGNAIAEGAQEAGAQASQMAQEAQQQIQAVTENANVLKEEIESKVESVNKQAEEVKAQIDEAAEAQISEIEKQTAQFEKDLVEKFQPLNIEAKNIISEADKIAKLKPLPAEF